MNKTTIKKKKIETTQYKATKLFDTFDGEHSLFGIINSRDCDEPDGARHSINVLRDTQGRELTLLGCELTDLAIQWLGLVRCQL